MIGAAAKQLYRYVTGDCHAYLANLEKCVVLPSLDAREQALRKLNAVPCIPMPPHRTKEQYPAFRITHADPADLLRLLGASGAFSAQVDPARQLGVPMLLKAVRDTD